MANASDGERRTWAKSLKASTFGGCNQESRKQLRQIFEGQVPERMNPKRKGTIHMADRGRNPSGLWSVDTTEYHMMYRIQKVQKVFGIRKVEANRNFS